MLNKIYKLGKKEIQIAPLKEADIYRIVEFQNFINDLIKEDAQIKLNQPLTRKDERAWFFNQIKKIQRAESVYIFSIHAKKIVGCASIDLCRNRRAHIGELGIAISRNFRGIGLGKKMIQILIQEARKKFKKKIKMISLSVFATNLPAIKLYEKFNFKVFARIPKQFRYKNKFIDELVMIKYL